LTVWAALSTALLLKDCGDVGFSVVHITFTVTCSRALHGAQQVSPVCSE